MPWTVTWQPAARADLARIWIAAANRQSVADAANRIDRTLKTSADTVGQEFFGDRIYVDAPLAVVYTLDPNDQIVDVVLVWSKES